MGRIWCPVVGRLSRTLTTARGKQGCCHSPAVLTEGQLVLLVSSVGSLWVPSVRWRDSGLQSRCPHRLMLVHLLGALASLLSCQHISTAQKRLHLGLVSCKGCRVAKGPMSLSWAKDNRSSLGYSLCIWPLPWVELPWNLCLGRQRHSSSGLGRVQCLLC